ncbi:MAG: heparinase II/III family protein [Armatimonadetes bacterium]|nr:heparinase II/III family protein [Armatimonadota bacterium]
MLIRIAEILLMTGAIAVPLATSVVAAQEHPGLYLTRTDIERARLNIERFPWAKATFDGIKAEADKWTAMSPEELRALIPPQKAEYAYGFAGCPECHSAWTLWGNGGICDFSKPRSVTCPKCKRTFPDEVHPDGGDGWKDPADGKMYYFVGCYNSYVAQTITLRALDALSNAYAITGDEKYARSAAALFDALAYVYPTCTTGSIDYPGAPGGRFERTLYQVARVQVFFARYYDLLYNSPAMSLKSAYGDIPIGQHVEDNILRNGSAYCMEHLRTGKNGLTNGAADFLRGVVCVGLVLGIPEYIAYSLSGPYCIFNFLGNNLDRDGQYYETSAGYSSHALNLYVDMAEMLINHRSEKHPKGINLYEHPKLSRAIVYSHLDILCAGHSPRYGDWAPDTTKLETDGFSVEAYAGAERLFRRAQTPEARMKWASILNSLCPDGVELVRTDGPAFLRTWLLYHGEPVPTDASGGGYDFDRSAVMDSKGMVALRSDHGVNGRAAFMRYGPSVCHGHRDDLNLNFFALGRELTYDLGYSLGSAHVQTGWAKQTASHNLVVVNEKSQITGRTGGSLHLFAESDAARVTEVSSEGSYEGEGVSLYRRTLALIDSGDKQSYLVDIFRVRGGDQHDLIWHALGEEMRVEGVDLGDVEEGSLAGPDIEWGSRIGTDGDVIGEVARGPYWTPPPGNGYGFLYDVRRGSVNGQFAATWDVAPSAGESLRIDMLPFGDAELITARGPGILLSLPHARYAILRRKGEALDSAFASVLQPVQSENPVKSVLRLDVGADSSSAVGVAVNLMDGRTDYILSTIDGSNTHEFTGAGRMATRGRFAFVRLQDGNPRRMLLTASRSVSAADWELSAERASYWGTADQVDYEDCTITTSRVLPTDGSLVGRKVYVNRKSYTHKSCFGIRAIEQAGGRYVVHLDTDTLELGRGYVAAEDKPGLRELRNVVPLERGTSCQYTNTGFFNGKPVVANDGTAAAILDVMAGDGKKTILVPDPARFGKDQGLIIYEIQPGDTFEIPTALDIAIDGSTALADCTCGAKLRLGDKTYELNRGVTTLALR